jgi:universal stress protein E
MLNLSKLLAVVDFRQSEHYALPRAIELAKLFNCKLTVIANVFESYTELLSLYSAINLEEIKQNAIDEAKQQLINLTDPIPHDDIEIDYQVTWNPSLHSGLTEYINQNNFDLVVKTTRKHNVLEKILFTPTDWHLLRDTETNVLFVQTENWKAKSSILGAININDDVKHKKLNEKIIQATSQLATALNCKSNIFNAFPWPAIDLERFNHLFDKQDLFLEIKSKHFELVNNAVDEVGSITGKAIIGEGLEPEDGIPEIAKSTFSQIVVMGTVRRKGIEGMLIGNTAEKILDQINCEVLAIK